MKNVRDFQKMKIKNKPISMVTCYDFWTANLLAQTPIDCLLVGDSVAMVMHGYDNPIFADVDMMAFHTKAVVRGAPNKFVLVDMPFLSLRKNLETTMNSVEVLIRAGAQALKIEIVGDGDMERVHHIVQSGVPVVAHLGLTPQAVHRLGGFTVQHKDETGMQTLMQQAIAAQQAGCFAVLLECVPALAATEVTKQLAIPVIGIGAGVQTDGQVLVLQDMLGMYTAYKPKFVKTYLEGGQIITEAVTRFDQEIKNREFPSDIHTY